MVSIINEKWDNKGNVFVLKGPSPLEEKIKIAENLLKKGMSVEDVSETTGLSIQQIEKLKTDL